MPFVLHSINFTGEIGSDRVAKNRRVEIVNRCMGGASLNKNNHSAPVSVRTSVMYAYISGMYG